MPIPRNSPTPGGTPHAPHRPPITPVAPRPTPAAPPAPSRRRRSLLGAGGALLTLLALLAAAPEPAAGATGVAHRPVHPERDWMGSTVAAHEGRVADGAGASSTAKLPRTPGFDVSNWQPKVDWAGAYKKGARFAYIKATEGTTYRDPSFNSHYTKAYSAGFIRGAYHFATPNSSGAKAQADWFVAHGGGWSKDGRTLPPMVDIEYNPYGASCYGLGKTAMVNWIAAFVNEVHARTTRWATIYTSHDWWSTCTGNTTAFAATDPLFVARYASSPGTLPAGWPFHTFWQYANSGTFPGDQDYFNGPLAGLRNLANNT
ncbi:lysozyme [Actinacidiphila sp. ITFR-21]|uniref:lysozyme n=1 Tax=Actinacidiphila sp. ITFR-21 TaxID=3075199 RepID=UPI00288A0DD8|nr:lysozyme [Streptomyces sp. ITFR-21]WNI16788.1 lysozyme [Streptomyces sp. ITFR-21]